MVDWGAITFIVGFIAVVALAVVLVINPGGARESLRDALPDVLEAFGDDRAAEHLRRQNAQRATQPAPATEQAPAPLALRTWLDKANHQPDKNPHLVATGPSGSGKTTLVMAVLGDRPGHLVIGTPKHADDDPWGGFPAIRPQVLDGRFSFDGIAEAVTAVYQEMLRRNTQGSRGVEWLTLVLDDYGILIGKIPELSSQVLDMVALGRSVRIRVVLLSTETNVKAWGWEGRSEARESCLWIECEEDTRRAVMYRWSKRKEAQPIDTSALYQLAQRTRLAGRVWPGLPRLPVPGSTLDRPVSVVSVPLAGRALREVRVGYRALSDDDAFLRPSLTAAMPGETARAEAETFQACETSFRAYESGLAVSEINFSPEETARIAARIAKGEKKTTIVTSMPGYSGPKHRAYAAYYERLRQAIENA